MFGKSGIYNFEDMHFLYSFIPLEWSFETLFSKNKSCDKQFHPDRATADCKHLGYCNHIFRFSQVATV